MATQIPGNANSQPTGNQPQVFRTGGSGFTAFYWAGEVIGFAQSVAHQSPQPVAPPVPIQPLDAQYPLQIIVPAAVGPGTLQCQLFEMYNTKVWDSIMTITDTKVDPGGAGIDPSGFYNDLSTIFLRLSALPRDKWISCAKIIYPPNTGFRGGPNVKGYADVYHNCVITDIRDDESIQVGTMEVVKTMTIMYTYTTRHYETTAAASS